MLYVFHKNIMMIPVVSGLTAMFFWGINALFEKKSVDRIGTVRSIIYVHIFLIALGFPLFLMDGNLPDLDVKFFIFVFIFGAADFLGLVLFYQAFKITKISIITPITSSYAIVTAIISFLFFGESFSLAKLLLIFLVVAGIVLLSIDLKELKTNRKMSMLGIIYAICIFFIYGIFAPLWDQFIEQGGWLLTLEIERLVILSLAVIFFAYKSKGLKLRVSKKSLSFTFLSALCIGTANTVFNWGLYNSTQTSIIAAISSAYPLVVAVCAFLFLKEKLKLNQYIGIVVILTGLVLIPLIAR